MSNPENPTPDPTPGAFPPGGVFPCLICGGELRPALGRDGTNQPHATMFIASGNYGSGLFDPTVRSREYLQVNICDGCLAAAAAAGRVMHGAPVRVEQPVLRTTWQAPTRT